MMRQTGKNRLTSTQTDVCFCSKLFLIIKNLYCPNFNNIPARVALELLAVSNRPFFFFFFYCLEFFNRINAAIHHILIKNEHMGVSIFVLQFDADEQD